MKTANRQSLKHWQHSSILANTISAFMSPVASEYNKLFTCSPVAPVQNYNDTRIEDRTS